MLGAKSDGEARACGDPGRHRHARAEKSVGNVHGSSETQNRSYNSTMTRWIRPIALIYGVLAYALGVRSLLYFVAFVGAFLVPKTIDSGPVGPPSAAAGVDTLLVFAFALSHSLLARRSVKDRLARRMGPALVRSTYVAVSSISLSFLMWQWRPILAPVWSVPTGVAARVLQASSVAGWVVALVATLTLGQPKLFGLRQAWAFFRRRALPPDELRTTGVYRLLRHPMYLGFVAGIWATPAMTSGHLLLAVLMTIYVVVGARFEEDDLRVAHGGLWEDYRARVPAVVTSKSWTPS